MTPERFEIIEHTADAGIRAYGRDLPELFSNAAAGMLEIAADTKALDRLEDLEAVEVRVCAPSLAELMVVWLEELLYQSESRGLLFRHVEMGEAREGEASGTARGAPLEENRGALRHEIKAVTYHRLEVKPDPAGGWTCQVIFDV